MDKRSYLGILLIGVAMAFVVLWSGRAEKKNAPARQQYEQALDSARAAQDSLKYEDVTVTVTAAEPDSLSPLFPALNGEEQQYTLDNGLVKIGISNKGAVPCFAQLSGYLDQQGGNHTV